MSVPALMAAAAVLLLWPPGVPHIRVATRVTARVRRPRPGAHRAAQLEWLEAVVAELRAGRDPRSAVAAASRSLRGSVTTAADAAARSGGDVAMALRADARGSELLRGVAACWEVAQGSGAGLAASLTTLADAARETERIRRELHAGLAEPRATAVVLAGLPVVGLLLGSMLGADPLAWLVGSPAGWTVLALGVTFEVIGALWAWHIATSLESEL